MSQVALFDDLVPPNRNSVDGGINVYCFENTENKHLKIGIARNVQERLRNIQTGSSARLRLVATRLGTIRAERSLHKLCAHDRLSGEWFRPTVHVRTILTAYFRRTEWTAITTAALTEGEHEQVLVSMASADDERAALKYAYNLLRRERMTSGFSALILETFGLLNPLNQALLSVELRIVDVEHMSHQSVHKDPAHALLFGHPLSASLVEEWN